MAATPTNYPQIHGICGEAQVGCRGGRGLLCDGGLHLVCQLQPNTQKLLFDQPNPLSRLLISTVVALFSGNFENKH
jgi:hypothetical protein